MVRRELGPTVCLPPAWIRHWHRPLLRL